MNRDLLLVLGLVFGLGAVLGSMWIFGVFSEEGPARIEGRTTDSGRDFETASARRGAAEPPVSAGPAVRVGTPDAAPAPDVSGPDVIEERDAFGTLLAGIDVIVTDPEGGALAGAVATLFADQAPGHAQHVRGEEMAASTTDEAGTLRFEDLRGDGEVMLRVRHPAYRDAHVAPVVLTPGRYTVVRCRLEAGLDLEGRVVDADSGAPLEGVEVRAEDLQIVSATFDAMEERRTLTDADGRYRLSALGVGPKRLVAHREGYATASHLRFDLDAVSARAGVDFELRRGLEISGTVTDPDGRPIAGAEIGGRYQPLGSGQSPRHVLPTTSDARGRYVLSGLVEGYYTLRASAPGYREGSVLRQAGDAPRGAVLRSGSSMRNARAGDRDVELVLLPAATVSGRVVDARTGEPIPAFEICVSPRPLLIGRGGKNSRRFVDEDGRFTMSAPLIDQAKKEIYLFALAPGFAGGQVEVDLASRLGSEESVAVDGVEIRVSLGGRLALQVVDLQGRPVSDARVQVYPVESGTDEASGLLSLLRRFNRSVGKSGATDAEGKVVVAGLLEGSYRVRIEHPDFAVWEADAPALVTDGVETALGRVEIFRGGTVIGTVKDPAGQRIESALVRLRSLEITNGEQLEVRTGVAGVFTFRHVPPGRYRLSASRGINSTGESGGVLDLNALLPGAGPARREFLIAEGEELREDLELR